MENIDWKHLPFKYMKTDYNIRCSYKDGKWGKLEVSESEYIQMHFAATCLHYGQEAFEGLKAYRGKDDKIRLFRWQENAKRMRHSAVGISMPEIPEEIFGEAVKKAVSLNEKYVPPYGSGATLYIRPLLIGTGAEVGVKAAKEYMFLVLVTPVGPYYKHGFETVDLMIIRNFDRTAPKGTGSYKIGGNYAASLNSLNQVHQAGYTTALFLDAKEKKYIDEAGTANFFGIKGNSYITPKSDTILPSITNKSLMEIARELGLKVEQRPIPVEELADFDEAGACGTAAVISPVASIYDPGTKQTYQFSKDGSPGPVSTRLYERLTTLQFGDTPDNFNWIDFIE